MGETIQKNEITKELENAEVLPFGKKDFNAYNRLMANIEKGFTKASEAYVLIACNLWQINRSEYFRIDSYKTIADFALEKYDMKKSSPNVWNSVGLSINEGEGSAYPLPLGTEGVRR